MPLGARLVIFPGAEHLVITMPVVEAAVRADVDAIAQEARALAPVRTGRYRDSISGEVEHSSEGARGRVAASASYALFIEFGTSDTPTFAPISRAARGLGLSE